MIPDELLDSLVELSSAGASGVCIFAIFWVGWVLKSLPENASYQKHKTLRYFMAVSIGAALISGATGMFNAWNNKSAIETIDMELRGEEESNRRLKGRVHSLERAQAEFNGMVSSIQYVLDSKESDAIRSGSDEMREHVQTLRRASDQLSSVVTAETELSPADKEAVADVLDEWVIRVGEADSRSEAVKFSERFTRLVRASGYSGTSAEDWSEPLVVPDPILRGKWLVVVDPSSGGASGSRVLKRRRELAEHAEGGALTELAKILKHSSPLEYRRSDFEATW